MNRTLSLFALLAVSLLAVARIAAGGTFETNLHKSFPMASGGKLVLDADRGSVDIQKSAAATVEVEILRRVKNSTEADAAKIFNGHTIVFDSQPKVLTIKARSPEAGWKLWQHDQSRLEVRYVISVPASFNLELKTAGGSITICDLQGEVRAETSGGSLEIGEIQGGVWGKTSGGNIHLAGSSGASELRTSGGSIRVKKCGSTLFARTSGGNIEVTEAGAGADLETAGGSINVGKVYGKVMAKTSGGNIQIKEGRGAMDVGTSGGSITATLAAQPDGDCQLHTSGGGIELRLPETIGAKVDARTTGGRVTSELPLTGTGTQKAGALVGQLGQGGSMMTLRTSGGSIVLKKI